MPLSFSRRRALAWPLALPLGAVLQALPRGSAAAGRPAAGATGRTAATATPLDLPPLPLRQRTLANGLQVVSLHHHLSTTVSVQVWYRVGAKDDPEGRSGFAHLFEHLMFKRTRFMADEMFDRLTEDVGGQNNAFTAEDMTVYQNDVPSNHLERLLWAEAERMSNLNVDQRAFDSERKVVIEELHQRVLADPYGRLFNALPQQGFERHPYRRPVIGSQANLESATLDDVRRFHATYYRPDNALLLVVGDFDAPQLDAWVDRYFGPLAAPPAPIPRVDVREPPRERDRRAAVHGPDVPLPAVALLWKGPPAAHADAPALSIASALLSAGDSSRLNTALVYRAQSAQSTGFAADLYADAGLISAYAIAASAPGALGASGTAGGAGGVGAAVPLPQLESQLLAEIRRLAEGPLPAAELDKVRTQLLTGALLSRQTPQGLAQAIGMAALLYGDAQEANRSLARLQAVTAADVRRVLRRWVLDAHRMTLSYTQGGVA